MEPIEMIARLLLRLVFGKSRYPTMQRNPPAFTDTARAQLGAWTQMSAEIVASLFLQRKTVLLGNEPCSNRVRHLFFCEPELDHVVLVHETVDNHFVEVLRAEVGQFGITQKKMRRAVRLQNEVLHHAMFCVQTPPTGVRLIIKGRFLDRDGGESTHDLHGFRVPDLPADALELIGNGELIESLRLRASQKGLDWNALHELLVTDEEDFYLAVPLP
jgi:hypothetical protein